MWRNSMGWIRVIAAWVYGIQVFMVVPWFLGAMYREEQSPLPWIEFEVSRRDHGFDDALFGLYLYGTFYSVPVVLTFFLLGFSRSRHPQPPASSYQQPPMPGMLSLWVGYTFFLSLPAFLEFVRALSLSFEVLGGWLFAIWLLVSLLTFPITLRAIGKFLG